jgi:threonine dehydratase
MMPADKPWHLQPPEYSEIEAAAVRIAAVCVETPLLESATLNQRLGARLFVKAEGLQRTGSFKLRGAFNRLSQLDAAERARGVVAYSSGNHAQAVAAAAQMIGTHAVIVMPTDAPLAKLAGTRRFGAEIVQYDRYTEDRVAITERLMQQRGLVLVPPFDDRRIIAGAGTLGCELALQLRERDMALDALLVGCGGGGLIAGCATAFAQLSPATAVMAVEPLGFDDTARSLAAGQRLTNDTGARTICDALMVSTPGEVTFEINRRLLSGAVQVSDAEVITAMRVAWDEFRLTVEPGGVVALAAVLNQRISVAGNTIGVVLTGSNIDPKAFSAMIATAGM